MLVWFINCLDLAFENTLNALGRKYIFPSGLTMGASVGGSIYMQVAILANAFNYYLLIVAITM